MYLYRLEPAIFGVISFWFVMTSSEQDNNHNIIKPIGPKMCDHLCSRRIGCSGHFYTPLHLSCRLIVEKIRLVQLSLAGTYYHRVSKIFQAKGNLTCPRKSKIFYTRRNIPKCKRSQIKPSRQRKFTRLLMLPCSINSEGRQLYLRNKTVRPYPHIISNKGALAVAYISSTRKLMISDGDSLFLMTLGDTAKTIISYSKDITGITEDEDKQLVFLTSYLLRTIHVMTTEGKDKKLIIEERYAVGQVAADSQRQMIYVVIVMHHIARYTYKGELQGIIAKGHIYSSLFFNSRKEVLYYIAATPNWSFFKMFLSNGTEYAIPSQVKPYPSRFYVYSNTLYFIPYNERKLTKLSMLNDNSNDIETIKTGFNKATRDVILCAIP